MNAVQKQAARNFVWGKDVSGARDGAAGIGGLLYLTANGVVYVPQYDVSGNILAYCDANGNIVASYTYDAFGNTIAQSGPLAGFFRHRFSTKYFDSETGNSRLAEYASAIVCYAFCGRNDIIFT